ncbi:HAD hydrolase family protein [Planococcus sp. APC 3900]|uniref:HAD hydrolase family protein n=1 Tax=Planococcus sp. APC 3900 TaxID=3035191 RepID=UPI0025B2838F|nr:HAD hydrolase family protein [Planococcus sp. APC 3900]MDN3437009.1 HAD hydrolase family protein [Planococcus sp. APC 3900]
MTVLFASDLDQTLIYSRNSMGMDVSEDELVEVERYEGKPLSYMTKKSQSELWKINESAFFLPVTTRTQAQYERVTGIFEGKAPRFAVISNGAVILENGQPIKEWSDGIRQQCVSRKTIITELLPEIERHFSEDWVLKVREADDWFVYLIVDRARFPEDKLDFYTETFKKLGWGMSLQGRKLYFMPESITKAGAMEYIKKHLEASYVIAAGDSLLDLDLLESADYSMLASHGEAVRSAVPVSGHVHKTEKHGIKAGEEILARVAEISLQRK